jgi:hypothetical protein
MKVLLPIIPMHVAVIWYLKTEINTRVSKNTQQVQLEPKEQSSHENLEQVTGSPNKQ